MKKINDSEIKFLIDNMRALRMEPEEFLSFLDKAGEYSNTIFRTSIYDNFCYQDENKSEDDSFSDTSVVG
jgi:hypothetical protein